MKERKEEGRRRKKKEGGITRKGEESSTGAFRTGATAEERFEGLFAGLLVQEALSVLGIHLGGEELVARFTQLGEPFLVFGAELIFELFPEALSKCRALPGGRDGDLQSSALDDGRIVEIAKRGNIHDVAEYAAPCRFFKYAFMKFRRGSGGDDQEHSFKIVRLERALMPFDSIRLRPGADLRGRFGSDHAHAAVGFQEAGNFGFSDGSRSDDEAGAARELEKHGEELFRFHALSQLPLRGAHTKSKANLACRCIQVNRGAEEFETKKADRGLGERSFRGRGGSSRAE